MATPDFHIIGDTRLDGSGFQQGLGKLGSLAAKGLAVVSGALAGMGACAVKAGSDFEAGMSEVAAISGATGEELDALAAKAKEMGATTRFSAAESAEALKYMAMAGWDTADMLAGLPGVMNLAAASGEALATVSDIVTDAMTAFGETIDEGSITHFADVLAATAGSANTNVGLMGETFQYVAPLAGALGYSIDDTALAIGLMANAGLKGSQAGTALRAILARLTKPTGEVSAAMAELGLSLTDAGGQVKPLGVLLQELRTAFAGLGEAEQAQMAAALGGQEAMTGLLALVTAGEQDYNNLAQAIQSADGSAGAMADTMQDNLQGAVTMLKSALEGLGIQFYESISAPLRNVVGAATACVDGLSAAFASGGLPALVQAMGGMLADAATALVQGAPPLISAAVSVVDSLAAGLAANAPQLLDAAAALGGALFAGLMQLLPTIGSFGASLLAELIPRLIDGLPQLMAVGAQMLQSLADGLRTGIPVLLAQALPMLAEFTASLRANIGLLIDAGIGLLQSLAQGLIDALPTLIATVPQIVSNIAGLINDNAPKLLMAAAGLIGQLVAGLLQNIPVILANLPQIIRAIADTITAFNWLNLGSAIVTGLVNGVLNLIPSVQGAFTGMVKTAGNIVRSFGWESLGRGVLQLLTSGLKSLGHLVPNALKAAGSMAVNAFKSIPWLDLGKFVIDGIAAGISGAIGGLIDAAVNAAKSAFNAAKEFLGIASPSRLFRDEVGKMIPQGMAIGIEADTGKVAAAADELAKAGYREVAAAQKAAAVPGVLAQERAPAEPPDPERPATVIQQTNNFHTHDSLSPSELTREAEDMAERLKWKLP